MKSRVSSKVSLKVCNTSLVLLCLASLTVQAQTRCGVERWPIKTGTDSGATGIDLTSVQPTTLATLVQIEAPDPIPPNDRVSGPETTVWQINATLTAFKFEDNPKTGDSDYHLVLTDQDTGLTMIAEIPFPGCVDPASTFLKGITNARQEFDAQFSATSAFQDVSVPVSVTGIGMFDFSHGQRGYAENGIELHPVLDISFQTAGPENFVATERVARVPRGKAVGSQLLNDPSFENVAARKGAWTASPGVIDDSRTEPAHTGRWKAWLGGTGRAHTDVLSQTVTIPAAAHKATLSFWLRIESEETTKKPHDRLTVAIRTGDGQLVPIEEGEYSDLDVTPWGRRVFDVSKYIGQRITVTFTAKEDNGKATSFLIDDCRLVVQ